MLSLSLSLDDELLPLDTLPVNFFLILDLELFEFDLEELELLFIDLDLFLLRCLEEALESYLDLSELCLEPLDSYLDLSRLCLESVSVLLGLLELSLPPYLFSNLSALSLYLSSPLNLSER